MKKFLYTTEQVHQVVDEVLRRLDSAVALQQGPAHLENDIPQNSSPENTKVTLTVPEAARLIGISNPKMYELVRAGQVHSIRVGKKILISRKSLSDWLRKGDSYEKAC